MFTYILLGEGVEMYRMSEFTKNSYRVKETADILGVTPKTIRVYDKEGKIKTSRTEGNQRIIMRDDLISFLDKKGLILDDTKQQKRDVIYARVSSHDQKNMETLIDRRFSLLKIVKISRILLSLKKLVPA